MIRRLQETVLVPEVASPGPPLEFAVALACACLGFLAFVALAVALRPSQMKSEAAGLGLDEDEALSGDARPVTRSPFAIWTFTALNVPYGFALAAQGLMVAPLEAERLWPESHSAALGAMAALAGAAQLIGPQAGHWSDTYRSSLGRRRPLLLMSVALAVSLTFSLWCLSMLQLRLSYLVVFFLQQVVWNVIVSTQAGLVPDLVPDEQQDLAGGFSAANILVGAVAAFAYVHWTKMWDYHLIYGTMSVLLLFFCVPVCVTAQEKSSLQMVLSDSSDGSEGSGSSDEEGRSSWLRALKKHYTYDWFRYRDFSTLLVTKTLYCASVVVKTFLLFFVQDLFKSLPNSRYEDMVSEMAATAEVSAAFSALGLMLWLARTPSPSKLVAAPAPTVGARRSLVCLRGGASWMALMWLGPVVLGGLANAQSPTTDSKTLASIWLPRMLIGLGIWGVGQGVYLAGDQALAFVLLPDKSQASRYLGFSSLCTCIGSIIGGAVAAALLAIFGAGASSGYSFPGYAAIFIFASILSATISVVASGIQVDRALTS